MNDIAIRAEHLSKRYRLGGAQASYKTLRESLVAAAYAPLNWLRGRRSSIEYIWALDDDSFDIKKGEAVGVIGRNGAGKSTLLKILSRITRPTAGRVEIFGRVGSLLEVGTGFHPELTGRENIYLNGAILGMSRREIERKFDEIVAFAETEKFLDTPVKFYSSGMYVRLAFAVAAHLEPEILVVDEVLAVGDAAFQSKCLGKMGEVSQEGRTVIFVSHNMGAISRLCSRVILLKNGKIRGDGIPQDVIETYYESIREQNQYDPNGDRIVDSDMGFVRWSVGSLVESPNNHTQYSQQPCDLCFLLNVRVPIKQTYFGIAMYAQDGQLIWSMRSEDQEESHFDLSAGQYEVRFAVPSLPLRQGRYHLLVSANTQSKQYDLWDVEPGLEVLPWEESGLPLRWQGILNLAGKFTIAALDER